MKIILFIVVFFLSYLVGAFGFSQIVGSIQTRQPAFLFTIILWAAILLGVYLGIKHFLSVQIWGCYMGYAISLIMVLGSGKIE